MNSRLIVATFLTALLFACTASHRELLQRAADKAREAINGYCDTREEALKELGAAGAKP